MYLLLQTKTIITHCRIHKIINKGQVLNHCYIVIITTKSFFIVNFILLLNKKYCV